MSLLSLALVGLLAGMSRSQGAMSFDEAFRALSSGTVNASEAQRLKAFLGKDLPKGARPNEDLRFIFALTTASTGTVRAASDDGKWTLDLPAIAGTDLHAAAATLPEGTGFLYHYEVGSERLGGGQLEAMTYPPEAKAQPGVPKGQQLQQPDWKSKVFEGTNRHWWIYVPSQYEATKPACLFVVQDAQWQRGYWAGVMDNMIAQKDIPVSIGVFLTPGVIKEEWDNRSVEYDTVSDRYVTMLADEILPQVMKQYSVRPEARAHLIGGASSGAICAFNAAWQRPDLFGKVVSWIGSYTNLQGGPTGVAGGNTYPAIIRDRAGWDRKGEPKAIRVFLQDGANDIDNKAGSWPLANQEMARALEFGRYDYKFVFGQGFHSDKHGQVTLPDALRWMWRDFPK